MKSLLPWLVTTLALATAALFYISNKSRSEELAKLRLQQSENRPAEVGAKGNQVSSEELERLRKNTEDLLRLRNEVQRLRNSEKELIQQVKMAQAAAHRAQPPAPTPTTNATPLTPAQQAFVTQYGMDPRDLDHYGFCLVNVSQLDAAKNQWASANQKAVGANVAMQQLLVYLKDGVAPLCPEGGNYTLNAVGTRPACSIPRHAPPQPRRAPQQ